jgi:hypothetical protein
MKVGLAIGAVMNRIILSIAFYLMFFPIGMIMRLFRNDPIARQLDPQKNTYRIVLMPAVTPPWFCHGGVVLQD